MIQPIVRNQRRFVVPSLNLDGRGVALGPKMTVVLPTLGHLVGFLRGVGRSQRLAQVFGQPEIGQGRVGRGKAIYLRYDSRGSHAADRVAAVARLHQGQLYTGDAAHAVRYRDGGATQGYDAEALHEAAGQVLYDRPRRRLLTQTEALRFEVLATRLALTRDESPQQPRQVFIRGPEVLVRRLMRRLRRRGAQVEVALLEGGEREMLLRVRDLPPPLMPMIQGLPRVTAYRRVDQRLFVEHGRRHPLDLSACAELITGDTWLFFAGDQAEVVQTPPVTEFAQAADFDTYALGKAGANTLRRATLDQAAAPVALRLVETTAPQGTVEARLLTGATELARLRDLIYLAPQSVLDTTRVVLWPDHAVITDTGARAFPLGRPLRRASPNLLVPLHAVVRPALPTPALEALVAPNHTALCVDDRGFQWPQHAERWLTRMVATVLREVEPTGVPETEPPILAAADVSVFRLFWERL